MMLEHIRQNRQGYLETIDSRTTDFFYRTERYKQSYSIAIGFTNPEIDLSGFASYTRQTDDFIVLEKNICAVVLDCAPANCGIKAATNMLSGFQSLNFGQRLYTSVVSSENQSSSKMMINQLFDVLEYSIANNMDNMVVDPDNMMGSYDAL